MPRPHHTLDDEQQALKDAVTLAVAKGGWDMDRVMMEAAYFFMCTIELKENPKYAGIDQPLG